MPFPVSGQVGPTSANAADGTTLALRQGHTGEAIVQELHGRYFETMARGACFTATNQAATAVSAGVSTAYTGLLIYNPVGSNKMLVLNKLKFALSAAPAAAATIGLLQGFAATGGVTAFTTPTTIQSNQIGNLGKPVGQAYSAATIVTPTWLLDISDAFTAAAFPAPTLPIDLEGLYGILPGGFVAVGALTTVTGLGFISWEEVTLNSNG